MHVIRLKWWWWMLCLLILLRRIESLHFSDLGLPNQSNCAFASNKTLYIIGESKNISIVFDNDVYENSPKMIAQQQNQNQQINRQVNTDPACIITRSGKVILIPQQQQLQIIQEISPNLTVVTDTEMTFGGSPAAIDKFITRSAPLTNYTLTSFNDYVMIQGGQDANQTESQNTYILDLRYPAMGVWYELPATPFAPPASSVSNSALYATSRWILHFRTEIRQNQYMTFVDCFDPFTFLWLGTITSFNTTSRTIKAIPFSAAAPESDSLIIIPTLSSLSFPATQGFNLSETATNNLDQTTFWKLDISKWIFNNITITPIIINNINNHQKRDGNQTSLFFSPVLGGTVTLVAADLAVFYGGTTATDQQENLLFFNTTEFKFLPQPPWLSNNAAAAAAATPENNNSLAIILGSVMGSVLFIALLILFVWCCIRRKRSRDRFRHDQYHGGKKKNSLLSSMSRDAMDPGSQNMAEPSSNNKPYVLSPIKCLSPIDLFPAPSNPMSKPQEKDSKPPLTSRFIEHFDYNAFPLEKTMLGNMAPSSSLPQLKIDSKTTTKTPKDGSSQKQLPRSVSSYV